MFSLLFSPSFKQAVKKILGAKEAPKRHSCVLEISPKGIKMIDKSKHNVSLKLDTEFLKYAIPFCMGGSINYTFHACQVGFLVPFVWGEFALFIRIYSLVKCQKR